MHKSSRWLVTLIFIALLAPSVQAGRVWEKTTFPGDKLQSRIARIVPHPTDPNTIYVPTTNLPNPLGGTGSPADGLWVTSDKGDSWSTLNDGVLHVHAPACAARRDLHDADGDDRGFTVRDAARWRDDGAALEVDASRVLDGRLHQRGAVVGERRVQDPRVPVEAHCEAARGRVLDQRSLDRGFRSGGRRWGMEEERTSYKDTGPVAIEGAVDEVQEGVRARDTDSTGFVGGAPGIGSLERQGLC